MANVALLICSCDYYSECWEPIICSMKKYWPDCEYPKLIVSNHKEWNTEDAQIIKVGDHKGWASDTLKAISMTDFDYYIYFQEDYFLNKPVDNEAIKAHVQHCVDNHVDYLKISPDAGAPQCDSNRIGSSDYCENPLTKKYAINTIIAIWHRDVFKKICVPGYTGWDFEYKIIQYIRDNRIKLRSETLHTSVAYSKGITTIPGNGIQRGKWTRAGAAFLKENGFEQLIIQRPVQGRIYSYIYRHIPKTRFFRLFILAILKLMRKMGWD